MQFTTIEFGSALFVKELALRNEVLRKPLGLDLLNEDLAVEKGHWHFGLVAEDGGLAACVVLVPMDQHVAQLRQMAVAAPHQRTGLGSELVRCVEQHVAARGVVRIILHARVEAIGFYQKLGYACEGDEYIEVGIQHRTMTKALIV